MMYVKIFTGINRLKKMNSLLIIVLFIWESSLQFAFAGSYDEERTPTIRDEINAKASEIETQTLTPSEAAIAVLAYHNALEAWSHNKDYDVKEFINQFKSSNKPEAKKIAMEWLASPSAALSIYYAGQIEAESMRSTLKKGGGDSQLRRISTGLEKALKDQERAVLKVKFTPTDLPKPKN